MLENLKSPEDALEELPQAAVPVGAIYQTYGSARRGGEYNSHLVFSVILIVLAATNIVSLFWFAWVTLCLVASLLLDQRPWQRKVALTALPGQMGLYLQVLGRAFLNTLPHYGIGFGLYLCIYPLRERLNLPLSSLFMLYAFYMVLRMGYVLVYTYALTVGSRRLQLRVFHEQRANLRTPQTALRHVWWTYFLGNVGLFVKCSIQVITIGGFEMLRQQAGLDLYAVAWCVEHANFIQGVGLALSVLAILFSIPLSTKVYYRTHRTFHTCKPLYDSIHAIHHRGILPTPLDSGTISPLEFIITDMSRPVALLIPNWVFVLNEVVVALLGHLPAHTSGTLRKVAQHHLAHHKFVVCNFGLLPKNDERWGTRFVPNQPSRGK